MDVKQSKARFGIIGNNLKLNQAINVALQVAGTDISVLINGESGTGKETIPQIIHQNSKRKHNNYIAVNCGAIPEGTVDSELFGHEKGSFTGANESRKGYFEAADNGTIFLDEIAELPLASQARLLRVLENGEYIKVGSSKAQKTNVRILAATNENMFELVKKGKFREDLYYRLNTISISLPPLRERGDDILLLFKKFAADFAENYKADPIELNSEAIEVLNNYHWPGNIRQLKNFVAQLSIIEKNREIDADSLKYHLPKNTPNFPTIYKDKSKEDLSEREILYKVLFDMKNDLTELKKITYNLIIDSPKNNLSNSELEIFKELDQKQENQIAVDKTIEIHESLSLIEQERKLIVKALNKHKDRRKDAAKELGISERTLYRKLKEFEI
ncbi:MAG: sigma-54 interaction domain-containing protein [Flavobacteriales bacterium]